MTDRERSRTPRYRLASPRIVAALTALTIAAPTATSTVQETRTSLPEVRALWVVRTTLTSPRDVETMVRAARESGFNTLLVQVRGRGDAYYEGGREPRAAVLASQPAFDPLAVTIARGHAAGLRVHAWVNVNLVASAVYLPRERSHVLNRHPEWLMVPRDLAEPLARLNPGSREYLDRLAQYVRARPTELEGLYLSPLVSEAADYAAAVVGDIVARYPVDGVHLDYVRYPNDAFDYSQAGLRAFQQSLASGPTSADPQLTASLRDGLTAAKAFPDRWRTFRQLQLTRLVVTTREAVKTARPAALLSAAVIPDPAEAAERRLQDWRDWLDRGLLDAVCPMAYTVDAPTFESQVAAVRRVAGSTPVWAGIGAHRLSQLETVASIRTARRLGADGIVLFSYDSLTGPSRGPGYLSAVGRAAFAD